MAESLKILLLEDDNADAEIICRLLTKDNLDFESRHVMDKETFVSALNEYNPDVILADNSLPQFSAREALEIVRGRSSHVPFIVVTGSVSEEFAAGIIKLGADDYILKDRMTRLPVAIAAAIKQQQILALAAKAQDDAVRDKIERQKEVTRIILQTQERERNILGRELHDNINQILASVSLKLGYYVEEPDNNLEIVESCLQTLQKAIAETRKLSHMMVMPSFSQSSLKEELEILIGNYAYKKIVQLDVTDIVDATIPSPIKETLFRIAQEQLSNIAKHASAGTIVMQLSNSVNFIAMVIRDDGIGFDAGQKRKGIGLTNIFSRVEPYNGTASMESTPGNGCTLSVKIPLMV